MPAVTSSAGTSKAPAGFGVIAYHGQVLDAWRDLNGQMNVGCFPLTFMPGAAALFKRTGVSLDAAAEHGDTMYMLETHLTRRRELLERGRVYIVNRLLGFGHNKMQFLRCMYHDQAGGLVAANECLALAVNAGLRVATPFRSKVRSMLWKIYEEQHYLPLGDGVAGRAIRRLVVPEAAGLALRHPLLLHELKCYRGASPPASVSKSAVRFTDFPSHSLFRGIAQPGQARAYTSFRCIFAFFDQGPAAAAGFLHKLAAVSDETSKTMDAAYKRVLSEFSQAVRRREGRRVAALFTEHGTYADCFYGVAKGRDAIEVLIDEHFFSTADRFLWTFHDPAYADGVLYAHYVFSYRSKVSGAAARRAGFEGVAIMRFNGSEISAYREVAHVGPMLASLGYAPGKLRKILLKDNARVWSLPEFAEHMTDPLEEDSPA